MNKRRMKEKKDEYPSLYDAFELGERVKRVMIDDKGNKLEYKGIILAITDDSMKVFWDTKDDHYIPEDFGIKFTSCTVKEIFYGKENYSPIRKEKEQIT